MAPASSPRRSSPIERCCSASRLTAQPATAATGRQPASKQGAGTYYSLDPTTGAIKWATNVVFGGSAGGFIGTAAYDGQHVYGSTALGDVDGPCNPGNPRDTRFQEPSLHVFDAHTGSVAWESSGVASFAPTTIAGGMVFGGVALSAVVRIRDAAHGTVLGQLT